MSHKPHRLLSLNACSADWFVHHFGKPFKSLNTFPVSAFYKTCILFESYLMLQSFCICILTEKTLHIITVGFSYTCMFSSTFVVNYTANGILHVMSCLLRYHSMMVHDTMLFVATDNTTQSRLLTWSIAFCHWSTFFTLLYRIYPHKNQC